MTSTASRTLPLVLPWALIGAACLGSFAATSSGTTRAPFLLEMSQDLGVSMPLVANLVSMPATAMPARVNCSCIHSSALSGQQGSVGE